jgi:hypothetical protein
MPDTATLVNRPLGRFLQRLLSWFSPTACPILSEQERAPAETPHCSICEFRNSRWRRTAPHYRDRLRHCSSRKGVMVIARDLGRALSAIVTTALGTAVGTVEQARSAC